MSRELVIDATAFGVRAAVLENGRLIDVEFADRGEVSVVDQVFLGRVRTIDPEMNAAFVDCGLAQDGLLDSRDARFLSGRRAGTPIARQLHEGQAIVVQVRRDAQGGKGPRLTTDVTLVGRYLVYHPRRQAVGISARLARSADGKAARARAARLFPEGGVTLRSAARSVPDDELAGEAARLRRLWQTIEARASESPAPTRLHGDTDPLACILTRRGPDLERILVADRALLVRVRNHLAACRPAPVVEHLPGAFAASGAGEQLAAALEPVVPLDGGGCLTIQETAALTAIDVDGGGRRPLDVDLDAADEIARQLRLRQIGGIVVVDFVDLPTRTGRDRVLSALRAAFAGDPAPVRIFPMSPLGLVQLSRRRTGPSLAERFGRRCPCCAGSGVVESLRRRAELLMDELAAWPSGRPPTLHLAPDIAEYLRGEAASVWADFGARLGGAPPLEVDRSLHPGDYRIAEARE